MSKGAGLAAAGIVSIVSIVSCSLTALDGFSGGEEKVPPVEAGADVDAGGAIDASGDASAESGPPSFCSAHPAATFCDDFERTELKGGWDETIVIPPTTLSSREASPGSHGRFVSASIDLTPAGDDREAYLRHELGTVKEVELAFRVRFDQLPTTNVGHAMDLCFEGPNGLCLYFDLIAPKKIVFVRQSFPNDQGGQYEPTPIEGLDGGWHDVVYKLKLTSPTHVELRIDGAQRFDGPGLPGWGPAPGYVGAGITYAEPSSGPISVSFDDVVVTTTK